MEGYQNIEIILSRGRIIICDFRWVSSSSYYLLEGYTITYGISLSYLYSLSLVTSIDVSSVSPHNSMFVRLGTDYEIRNQWFFAILETMTTD